jgi:single-stranded DNA-binding protein
MTVQISGSFSPRPYVNKNGDTVTSLDITAHSIEYIPTKKAASTEDSDSSYTPSSKKAVVEDTDIPF